MNSVLTAFRQFQVANGTLPCPADPTMASGNTGYGIAAANSGPTNNCMGGIPQAAYADSSKHIAIGMVPVKTLGLSYDYAVDGYGRDLTYAVDTNATGCWASTSLTGGITVNDGGTLNNTVAALVSHGVDGYGAWLPIQGTGGTGTATRLDSGSKDIAQADNAQVNNGTNSGGLAANGAGQFQPFYKNAPGDTGFDDVLVYQNPQWSLSVLPAASHGALTSYPANGNYSSGQTWTFVVTLPSAVTFTGTPQLDLSALSGGSIGPSGNKAYAILASGNGTKMLTFTYTIVSGDTAPNGIAVATPIDLNGGTVTGMPPCGLVFTPPNLSGVKIVTSCSPCIYVGNGGAGNVTLIDQTTNTESIRISGASSDGRAERR